MIMLMIDVDNDNENMLDRHLYLNYSLLSGCENISKLFNYDKDVFRAGSTLTLTTFILATLLKRLGSAKRYAGQIYRVLGCLRKNANRIPRTMLHLLSMAKFGPTAPNLVIND